MKNKSILAMVFITLFVYGCGSNSQNETTIDTVIVPWGKQQVVYVKDSSTMNPDVKFYINDKSITVLDTTIYNNEDGLGDSTKMLIAYSNIISIKDLKESDMIKIKYNETINSTKVNSIKWNLITIGKSFEEDLVKGGKLLRPENLLTAAMFKKIKNIKEEEKGSIALYVSVNDTTNLSSIISLK